MPRSFKVFDNEIREHINSFYPNLATTRILDVGTGEGKFRDLLYDYVNVDGVEIHDPYIVEFGLKRKYRRLYHADAVTMLDALGRSLIAKNWDVVILGDVLEYFTVEDAQKVLSLLDGVHVVVAVPYLYPQSTFRGNEHEKHLQPDLTPIIMRERYPNLMPLAMSTDYAVYYRPKDGDSRVQPKITMSEWSVSVEKLREANIAICTPIYDGSVSYVYTRSLFLTTNRLTELGIKHSLIMVQSTIEKGRNILVANFLVDPSYTHLLFIDSDEGWEVNDLLRLIAHDRDIIGIAGRKKVPTPAWAVNFCEGDNILDAGCLEVIGVGTGFLLIKRNVFEKLIDANPQLAITDHPEAEAPKGFYHALFQFTLHKGAYVSEDLSFCRRWRDIGGRVYIDPTAEVVHVGQYEYRGSVESLFQGDIRK